MPHFVTDQPNSKLLAQLFHLNTMLFVKIQERHLNSAVILTIPQPYMYMLHLSVGWHNGSIKFCDSKFTLWPSAGLHYWDMVTITINQSPVNMLILAHTSHSRQ